MTAHNLGWNGIRGDITMPDSTNGTDSRPFPAPQGARAITIYIPDLVGAGTTIKLQTLVPDQPGASEVWRDIKIFNLSDGTFVTLAGLVESTAVTLPTAATGGGIFKLVASTAQTGAADAIVIPVFFHMSE